MCLQAREIKSNTHTAPDLLLLLLWKSERISSMCESVSVQRSSGAIFYVGLTSDTDKKKRRRGANSREKKKSVLLKSEPPPGARSTLRDLYRRSERAHFVAMKRGELCMRATPHQVFRWSWSPTSERLFNHAQ